MIVECNSSAALSTLLVIIFLFLLYNYGGIHLFISKDKYLSKQYLDKFPAVLPEFWNKSLKIQNIENNQEIHDINRRLLQLERTVFDRKPPGENDNGQIH